MEAQALALRAHFERATPEQIRDGCGWYPAARRLVHELAHAYQVSEQVVAGVIAALSQRTRWSINIDRATHVLDGGRNPGGLGPAGDKAVRIFGGADPEVELGPHAHKVRAFYHALLGDDGAAVVDTWMLEAFAWHRHGYSRKQYEVLAGVLRAEAERVGFSVCEYQATVWCVVRGRAD